MRVTLTLGDAVFCDLSRCVKVQREQMSGEGSGTQPQADTSYFKVVLFSSLRVNLKGI